MTALFLEALVGIYSFSISAIAANRHEQALQEGTASGATRGLGALAAVCPHGSGGLFGDRLCRHIGCGDDGRGDIRPQGTQPDSVFVPGAQATRLGLALNAILFIPVGFFLPLLWKRCEHLGRVLGLGFALSLWVELSQLLNWRVTDIDDLITNTLGAVIGWLLYRLAGRRLAPAFSLIIPGRAFGYATTPL